MKLLLCHPPDQNLARFPLWMPLGLASLAAAFSNRPGNTVEVGLIDCPALNWDIPELLREVGRFGPDIIGFSFLTLGAGSCARAAAAVRRLYPDVLIVGGGAHVTGDPRGALKAVPAMDAGLRGEADESLPELMAALEEGWNPRLDLEAPRIRGLVRRRPDGKLETDDPAWVRDLDLLPFPDWELAGVLNYPTRTFFKADEGPAALVSPTRGCSEDCLFCPAGTSGIPGRTRSVKRVLAEISALYDKFGIKRIVLADEGIARERGYLLDLCTGLRTLDFKPSWSLLNGLRPDHLDREKLDAMKASGNSMCHLGLETGTDRLRRVLGKGFSWKKAVETVRYARKPPKIETGGFFILGLPGERPIDRLATIIRAWLLPIDRAVFLPFAALPGSPLYREAVDLGFVPSWSKGEFLSPAEEGARLASFLARHKPSGGTGEAVEPPGVRALAWWLRIAYILFYSRPFRAIRLFKELRGEKTGSALSYVWRYLSRR